MTVSGAGAWWRENVALSSDDFGSAPSSGRVGRSTAVGAGVGAVAGGAAAGVNAGMDEPYVDYVSQTVPRGEAGPPAAEVFGADHARLMEAVRARSSGDASATQSLQYLAHLKTVSPSTSPDVLSSLFETVENHFPKDEQARAAMNLVAAAVEKHPGTSPYGALADFLNEYNRTEDFGKASEGFAARQGLSPEDLQDTLMKLETKHTTMMGRFGMAGAVLIGAGAGAVLGAGVGAAVGALWNAIDRDEAPPAP